jgi:hypothetical protein
MAAASLVVRVMIAPGAQRAKPQFANLPTFRVELEVDRAAQPAMLALTIWGKA